MFVKKFCSHPFLMVLLLSFVVATVWYASAWSFGAKKKSFDPGERAPAFTAVDDEKWINSTPITWQDLRGKVTLIDFWTFDCWNCYRSFPWLNDLEHRYAGQDLQVIGIHSPEFKHEKDVSRVRQKVKEFKLEHPVMIDNDFRFWRGFYNRFWPAFYLVDKRGRVRGSFVGETHKGSRRAKEIEKKINQLLAEPA